MVNLVFRVNLAGRVHRGDLDSMELLETRAGMGCLVSLVLQVKRVPLGIRDYLVQMDYQPLSAGQDLRDFLGSQALLD